MIPFSREDEEMLAEVKRRVAKSFEKRFLKFSSEDWTDGTPEKEIKEDKESARRAGELMAEKHGVHYMFLYKIKKSLKSKGYPHELYSLIWDIDTEFVTAEQIISLYKEFNALLEQAKNANELTKLGPTIKQKLQFYIDLRDTVRREREQIMKEQAQQIRELDQRKKEQDQQIKELNKEMDAQRKKMEIVGALVSLGYDEIHPNLFKDKKEFQSWKSKTFSLIGSDEPIDAETDKLIKACVKIYHKKHVKEEQAQEAAKAGASSSSLSSSYSNDSKPTESMSKKLMFSSKRKERSEEEERESPLLRKSSSKIPSRQKD